MLAGRIIAGARRLALALPACAALVAPSSGNATAPSCAVDRSASYIRAIAPHDGANYVVAFERWAAHIAFDEKNLGASAARLEIDPASARTGNADIDAALTTPSWLAIGRFPTVTYLSRGFRDHGRGRYSAQGNLTLKGVTKSVPLSFSIKRSGAQAIATGTAWIHRRLFDIGEGEYAGADLLPWSIPVHFRVVATC